MWPFKKKQTEEQSQEQPNGLSDLAKVILKDIDTLPAIGWSIHRYADASDKMEMNTFEPSARKYVLVVTAKGGVAFESMQINPFTEYDQRIIRQRLEDLIPVVQAARYKDVVTRDMYTLKCWFPEVNFNNFASQLKQITNN